MSRVWTLARREWLELLRQKGLLASVLGLYALVSLLVATGLGLFQVIDWNEDMRLAFAEWLATLGFEPSGLTGLVVSAGSYLLFTQFLGIAAVLCGHTFLHDRQVNALPFLLLAPVRRSELILGKVLGAVGLPLLLYLVVTGAVSCLAALLPITAAQHDVLPWAPAWWVAYALGAPLWAMAIGTTCAIASSLSRDVRTAQQVVWFVLLLATNATGLLLVGLLANGVWTQLGVAALGAGASALALWVGSQVISRDLSS